MTDPYAPDEPLERFVDYTTPKARTDYICALCHRPIPKGMEHLKPVYKDENHKLMHLRFHLSCAPVSFTRSKG